LKRTERGGDGGIASKKMGELPEMGKKEARFGGGGGRQLIDKIKKKGEKEKPGHKKTSFLRVTGCAPWLSKIDRWAKGESSSFLSQKGQRKKKDRLVRRKKSFKKEGREGEYY